MCFHTRLFFCYTNIVPFSLNRGLFYPFCCFLAVESIPHAANISSPRDDRIVQTTPAAFKVSRNASILPRSELSNGTSGIAWKRIRLMRHFNPDSNRTRAVTCAGESLIPAKTIYSKLTRRWCEKSCRLSSATTYSLMISAFSSGADLR